MEVGPETRALVSGASRGIGLALSRALAARGARVGLLARPSEALEAAAAEIPGSVSLPADVADREQTSAATEAFVEAAGGLDIVVANAGIAHYGPFADLGAERARRMVEVNVMGTLDLVDEALPHLLRKGRGQIVVVSSGAGLRAFPSAAVYGATKAAQKAFAEALRHELSGSGVSVTTVFPGEVTTSLHDHESDSMPDWYRSKESIPASEVAEVIVEGLMADRREVFVPGKVKLLGLNDIAPGLVDRLLVLLRGGSAAPRRY